MSDTDQKQLQPQSVSQSAQWSQQMFTKTSHQISKFSDLLSQYQKIMGGPSQKVQQTKVLNEEGDELRTNYNFKKMPLLKILPEQNLESLSIDVHYGRSKTNITLFFVKEESYFHNQQSNQMGNYSTVYQTFLLGQHMAVKCIKYKDNLEQNLINLMIEVVIMLKASSLKAGPYYPEYAAGFHIIIYQECMQFMMEFCKIPKDYNIREMAIDLKQNLKKLHEHNIIHFDIKQSNIGFSNKYQRYVFLDYGLSKIVEEPLGCLTQTKFRGSLRYCSAQMKNLYKKQNHSQLIDLYYNDAHCLKQTLQQKQQNRRDTIQNTSFQNVRIVKSNIEKHYLIILKRFFVSLMREQQILAIIQKHQPLLDQLKKKKVEILQFILSLMNKDLYQKKIIPKVIENFDKKCEFDYSKYLLKHCYLRVYRHVIKQYADYEEDQAYQFYRSCHNKVKGIISSISEAQKEFREEQLKELQKLSTQSAIDLVYRYPLLSYLLQTCNVTTQDTTFSEKVGKLRTFMKIFKIPSEKSSTTDQECFLKIYHYCLKYLNSKTIQILNSIITSIILMQLITQQQFIYFIKSIATRNINKVEKLKLMLSAFTALYWIYTKIQTKYNYFEIMEPALDSLEVILADMQNVSNFQSNLRDQFYFLLKIIPITDSFRKKQQVKKLRQEFKEKYYPTLAKLAISDIFCKRLYYFINFTLIIKKYELSFEQQEHSRSQDEQKLKCQKMLITKRKCLDQGFAQNISSPRRLYHYLQVQHSHKFHLFQNLKTFQLDQSVSSVVYSTKGSSSDLTGYQKIGCKLQELTRNAHIVDQIQYLTVFLGQVSFLRKNKHVLQLYQLASMIGAIVDQIPNLVCSQNRVLKHKTPLFVKKSFLLLEIQQQYGAIDESHLQVRKKWLINSFKTSIQKQKCMNCKIQKLSRIHIQELKLLLEASEEEKFLDAVIAGVRLYIQNGYFFTFMGQFLKIKPKMSSRLKRSYQCLVSQVIFLVDFKKDKKLKPKGFIIIMEAYFQFIQEKRFQEAIQLCLKWFDYIQAFYYKQNIQILIETLGCSFSQGDISRGERSPPGEFRRFSTRKFRVDNKAFHRWHKDKLLQHLKVCQQMLQQDSRFVGLFLTVVLQHVIDYQSFGVKFQPYLLKIANTLNKLDNYCRQFILSNYYIFHVLSGKNQEWRKVNFLLKKSLKKRTLQSNIYPVLKDPGYRKSKTNELNQNSKIKFLTAKVNKLNQFCRIQDKPTKTK